MLLIFVHELSLNRSEFRLCILDLVFQTDELLAQIALLCCFSLEKTFHLLPCQLDLGLQDLFRDYLTFWGSRSLSSDVTHSALLGFMVHNLLHQPPTPELLGHYLLMLLPQLPSSLPLLLPQRAGLPPQLSKPNLQPLLRTMLPISFN